MSQELPVLVAGGGIGGLAAALALVRQGFAVTVLEQAAEIGEIGAGIQLGPNAFHAFDALGVGDKTRNRRFTDYMGCTSDRRNQVGKIPTDENFRKRFGNPYAVIHRQDIHTSLLEGAQETGKSNPTSAGSRHRTADTSPYRGKQPHRQPYRRRRRALWCARIQDPPRHRHVVYPHPPGRVPPAIRNTRKPFVTAPFPLADDARCARITRPEQVVSH